MPWFTPSTRNFSPDLVSIEQIGNPAVYPWLEPKKFCRNISGGVFK